MKTTTGREKMKLLIKYVQKKQAGFGIFLGFLEIFWILGDFFVCFLCTQFSE